jgi:hypothetical protein
MCPENHTTVRFVTTTTNKYLYRCAQAECQTHAQRASGYFLQERPNKVTSLSDRGAAWHDTQLTRAMADNENAASRTTTPINPALQATPHAGDISIGFHNKTGGHENDPIARKSQMDGMMARAHIWAVCEINTSRTTAMRFDRENNDPRVQHYTWWTDPPENQQARGTGIAIHIPKKLMTTAPTSGDYVYKNPNGKALAVNVTINNVLFLLIVIHGPHTDKDYAIFMDNLATNIGTPTPDRIPLIFGDFNFVEAPALDCVPPAIKQERPLAATGLAHLLTHIGAHWGGMTDAYRTVWGMQTAVTTHPKT